MRTNGRIVHLRQALCPLRPSPSLKRWAVSKPLKSPEPRQRDRLNPRHITISYRVCWLLIICLKSSMLISLCYEQTNGEVAACQVALCTQLPPTHPCSSVYPGWLGKVWAVNEKRQLNGAWPGGDVSSVFLTALQHMCIYANSKERSE